MDIKAKEVVSTLITNAGVGNQKAKVKFGIDRSVSIKGLYDSGVIQKLAERILPIALTMDDDKQVDLFVFEDRTTKINTPLTETNYSDFVNREIGDLDYGGTQYAPLIRAILKDTGCTQTKQITYLKKNTGLKSFFSSKQKETKAMIRVDSTGKNVLPTLAIIFTDGDCEDPTEVRDLMFNEAPFYPVFFQFIGVKSSATNYKFLSKLDTMGESFMDTTERFIDNANFVELTTEDLSSKTNEELYKMILGEFINEYLPAAKNQFLIK